VKRRMAPLRSVSSCGNRCVIEEFALTALAFTSSRSVLAAARPVLHLCRARRYRRFAGGRLCRWGGGAIRRFNSALCGLLKATLGIAGRRFGSSYRPNDRGVWSVSSDPHAEGVGVSRTASVPLRKYVLDDGTASDGRARSTKGLLRNEPARSQGPCAAPLLDVTERKMAATAARKVVEPVRDGVAQSQRALAHAWKAPRSATAAKKSRFLAACRTNADTLNGIIGVSEYSRWQTLGRSPRNSATCCGHFSNSSRHLLQTDQRYSRPSKVEARGSMEFRRSGTACWISVWKCATFIRPLAEKKRLARSVGRAGLMIANIDGGTLQSRCSTTPL